MAKQVFLTVSLETGNAVTNVKELKDTIKLMKKELESSTDPKRYAELENSIRKANTELKDFNKSLKEGKSFSEKITGAIKDGFKGIGVAIVGAFAVSKIAEFGKSVLESFNNAEIAARKLQSAVSVNGGLIGDFNILLNQSEELQKTSLFGDDSIQSIQTAALQFGLTTKEVEKLTPKIIDFASATGIDLNDALDKVLKGVEGSKKGLQLYGISLDDGATRSENLASITEQLTNKFEGQGKVLAETSGGSIKQMANAWDDLKEKFGSFISPAITQLSKLASGMFATAAAGEYLSEKIENERSNLNALVLQIQLTNEGTTNRKKLIDELNSKYPNFLGNLNKESTTNEQLSKKLKEVNNEYFRKILLVSQEERATAQAKTTGEAYTAYYVSQRNILKIATDKGYESLVKGKENANDQALVLIDALKEENKQIINGTISTTNSSAAILKNNNLIQDLYKLRTQSNTAAGTYNDQNKILQEDLAILNDYQSKFNTNTEDSNKSTEESINLRSLSIEKLKELKVELEKVNSIDSRDKIDAITKEIASREKLKQVVKDNNKDVFESEADLNKQIEDLNKQLQTDQLAAEKETLSKSLEGKKEGGEEAIRLSIESAEKQRQIELLYAGNNATKKLEINTRYNAQINQLNKNLINELNATSKGDLEREKVVLESKLKSVKKGSDEELKLKADLEKNKIALERAGVISSIQEYQNRVGGIESLNESELANYKLLLEKKKALDTQYTSTQSAEQITAQTEKEQIEDAAKQAALQGIDEIGNAIQASIANENAARAIQTEKRISEINAQKDAELQALDIAFQKQQGTYVAKTAAEKKYEADRKKIIDKAKAEEKALKIKQWQDDKKAAITSAYINMALGVIKAFATAGNPIVGAIFAAATVAASLIQINAINNQPQPNFRKGGIPKKNDGGVLSGPSHSDGGIQASVGGSPIELEGGEIILNKGVNANPKLRGIASELNSITGGVSFGSSDHSIRSMIRSNMYAMGGITRAPLRYDIGGIAGSAPVNVQNSIDFSEIRSFLQTELDKPRRSYVIESDITSSQNQTSVIERRAKLT